MSEEIPPPPPPDGRRPRAVRLLRSNQFAWVRTAGRTASGRYFRLSVATDPHAATPLPEARVGLITSRRIGGAVTRVRVRRRLRELHRLHRARLRPGLWIVLIGKTEAATAPWSALCTEWLRLGQKLSIFLPA